MKYFNITIKWEDGSRQSEVAEPTLCESCDDFINFILQFENRPEIIKKLKTRDYIREFIDVEDDSPYAYEMITITL